MMRYERRNRHLWVFKTKTQIKEVRKKKAKKLESMDRKIWLTNPPTLHTISYEKHPNSSQHSPNVCNQRFMKIFQLKSLKKKNPESF